MLLEKLQERDGLPHHATSGLREVNKTKLAEARVSTAQPGKKKKMAHGSGKRGTVEEDGEGGTPKQRSAHAVDGQENGQESGAVHDKKKKGRPVRRTLSFSI